LIYCRTCAHPCPTLAAAITASSFCCNSPFMLWLQLAGFALTAAPQAHDVATQLQQRVLQGICRRRAVSSRRHSPPQRCASSSPTPLRPSS
jgi:hypothetical protein